jgi:hypothetical protein
MSPDFQRHAAMVIVFGIDAVLWVRTLIWLWRKERSADDYVVWDFTQKMFMWALIVIPAAAYFIIKDAW